MDCCSLNLPHMIQALAVYVLAGLLPGLLLVDALVGQSEAAPTPWERILYAIGAGYAVMVMVMTGLSFMPGPLTEWQTLLAFDAIILVLAALDFLLGRRRPLYPRPTAALFPELDAEQAEPHLVLDRRAGAAVCRRLLALYQSGLRRVSGR